MKVGDVLVQNGEKHDNALHMVSSPVNMRLYRDCTGYRRIINEIILHMKAGAEIDFDDYPAAQGVSGANVGIPLNIVIINTKRGPVTFLNPRIIGVSEELVKCRSNCGSINLPKKIVVFRHRWVKVEYYDIEGDKYIETFTIGDDNPVSSATLQHEIHHNLGILITDIQKG